MSMSRNVYLGPFVMGLHRPGRRERLQVRGCTNATCVASPLKTLEEDYEAGDFCRKCGSPRGPVVIERKGRISTDDALGESERLSDATGNGTRGRSFALIPNVVLPGSPERDLRMHDEVRLELRSVDMLKEIAWFEKAFRWELVQLEVVYDNVHVTWGLLQWFS